MIYRCPLRFVFSGAAFAALALAACGGGGSGASGAIAVIPAQSPTVTPAGHVSIVIRIPKASGSSIAHRPKYISPNTQSIGVVVTNQGFPPSAAVFVNVASCPLAAGVPTCTISVLAFAGNDTFAITAYSGTNGGGSALSTGSVTATITLGGASPTVSVSLGGIVGSITVTALNATLPLSQTTTVSVAEKDASGAAIIGTYTTPVTLSGANLVISPTSLPDSTTASNVTIAWTQGYLGGTTSTLAATDGTNTGSLVITPASGFAYYNTGSNPATDVYGFKMILGGDGKLYYTTLGPTVCSNGFCQAAAGGIHQFDPTTLTDVEVPVTTEPGGLTYAPDGSVWVGGGPSPAPSVSPQVYRIPSGSFNAASLTTITMPGTSAGASPFMRSAAVDTIGNVWFNDLRSKRFLSIPIAGPYTTGSVAVYTPPPAPPGLPATGDRTVDFAGGFIIYGYGAGYVDVVNPSSGATVGQYLTNLETTLGSLTWSDIYDSSTDGTTVYYAQFGDVYAPYASAAMEAFVPSGAFTTMPTVEGLGVPMDLTSIAGGLVYYSGFGDIGVANPSSGHPRDYPIVTSYSSATQLITGGMAALPDGTAWFSCYGLQSLPICVGHTIYLSMWGLWPGTSMDLYGAGSAGAQNVGIMESPSANSGPFTVTSSNAAVCTANNPASTSDHNFTITGVAAGACTVTVTDAHSISQTINVTVTTTSGTVQLKRREGVRP